MISDNNVDNVRIRSVLTCEAPRGVCAKCYGWNLSTHNEVNRGTAVGIQAAQSIGEPGTQLTLRTFHIGGTATRIIEQSEMTTKYAGTIKYSDTLEVAATKDEENNKVIRCMVRNAKITVVDSKGKELNDYNVPYGSDVIVADGDKVKGGQVLFQWDPYTDLILARQTGKIQTKDFIEGETYHIEAVELGKKRMVIVEAKDRNLSPHIDIVDKNDKILTGGTILPVKATLVVRDGQKVQRGQALVKIPKDIVKTR
ncbi:MAG TPA: DNA-directed RNA polymerase subunit beta', partial [Candidatus Marinimicrobia bacterium]|nr:DNA-directed RNA polymerase subunit beta' [Candidatus Neomarinimicrobiota bacterium]